MHPIFLSAEKEIYENNLSRKYTALDIDVLIKFKLTTFDCFLTSLAIIVEREREMAILLIVFLLVHVYLRSGDKNISILHLSCRTSYLQFSTGTCPLKVYAIVNIRE